jgi:hypothetical protein
MQGHALKRGPLFELSSEGIEGMCVSACVEGCGGGGGGGVGMVLNLHFF